MTRDDLQNAKIVIFSHYATTGACEELRDWLVSIGTREVVYVAFPFGGNRDRAIRVGIYRPGCAPRVLRSGFRVRLPAPLAYAKDFAYAFLYALRFGRRAELLVAGDAVLALAGRLAKPWSRIRQVVYYMIDYTPVRYANRLLNGLYAWVDRAAAQRVDAVWPLTSEMIEARFAIGRLDRRRVHWQVVPYGCHRVCAPAIEPHTVVYLGDLVRSKGSGLLVPLAVALRRRVPDVRLVVIGGGPELERLRADVAREGLQEQVVLRGFVASMDEVLASLAAGAVAIAPYDPSDRNSFTFYADPGKVKVYLGCGLPIVLTDVPPIAKTVVREGAGLLAAYTPEDLAANVAAILRSPQYAAFRDRASALGRACEWPRVFEAAFAGLSFRLDRRAREPV